MQWGLALVVVILELMAMVGAIIGNRRQTTTGRAGRGLQGDSDNWKCPDSTEFARILNRPRPQPDDGQILDLSSLSRDAHPLWDRDLDT